VTISHSYLHIIAKYFILNFAKYGSLDSGLLLCRTLYITDHINIVHMVLKYCCLLLQRNACETVPMSVSLHHQSTRIL